MSDISLSKAVRTNLLSLQNTATMMNKTQERLATGNKVNSALDNPSNFFTASALNSRAADMSNLLDSMASGIKVIEAANNGLTALTKNLESMQSTLRQARQDKSFQTKSFEVGADSVLKLSGGALGNGVSEISLAEATKPGSKAQLTTNSTTPFLGVQSKADGIAGAGARSVISFAAGSFTAGDKFTVAGVEVEVADTDADSAITADDLVANIQAALAGSDVDGDYTVTLGEGDLDGKIIIESVDTSAAAAEVVFDIDEDPATGVNVATHGTTTFNYSAVNSSITVGGQQIETGTSYDQFVTNLRAGEKEGGYKVTTDDTTKQITLTSVAPGTNAPEVDGALAYRAAEAASATKVSFTLAASAEQGSFATTSFTLANSGSGLTHDQELTIDGFTDKVVLEATFSTTAVRNAIIDVVGDDYEVQVGTNFDVTLTAKTVGTTAPDVTSSQVAANQTTASMEGVGGIDMSGMTTANDLAAYAGTTITISDGTTSTSHTIANTDSITSLLSALNDNTPSAHTFAVSAGEHGLDIASTSHVNFTVTISNDGTDFGIGPSSKTSDNGRAAQTAGITVAANMNDGDPAGTTLLNDAQKLTIGDTEVTLTKGMTTAQVLDAIKTADNNAIGDAYDVSVDADFNVTLTDKTTGVTTAPTVTSDQVEVEVVEASHTLSTQFDFDTDDNLSSLVGTTITLTSLADPAVTVDYEFTTATTGQRAALLTALEDNGFTVEADGGDLKISRADGQNFTINLSTGPNSDMGMPDSTITTTNGVLEQANGIVGGNTDGVTPKLGEAAVAEIKGKQSVNGTPGASVEKVDAARNELTVAYGDKIANISISGSKGGVGSEANSIEVKNWQDATVASVNQQLKNQGITGLEAKFDDKGQLSLVAKEAEAKTLSISGRDSVELFGTETVKIGEPARSELSSTKPVDKFVELINRDYGGLVRASNDNGKLRIENLSTQKLDVGVAANKDADTATQMIEGNSVRANLSKQFNELRDQFDKLADDASFNGINLLRGDKLTITFNESGSSSISIQSKDKADNARAITASNMGVEFLDAVDLDNDEAIDAFLGKLSAALSDLRSQASTFGSNLSSVQNRQDFTKNMINTLEAGAANLTLADMNEEAANLLALQTRQSLSSSALSMASQQDQSILQLLR